MALIKITYPVDKGIGLVRALAAQGLRLWEQTDLGCVTPDDGPTVQALVDAYDPLPEARAAAIAAVKAEAQARINRVAPQWKQANLTARGVELLLQGAASWTAEQQAEVAAGALIWSRIKALRAASDVLETQVAVLEDWRAAADFDVTKGWPE